MTFTSKYLKFKSYSYGSNLDPLTIKEDSIALEKQSDGTYNVPSNYILIKVHAVSLNPVDAKVYHLSLWPIANFFSTGIGKDYSGRVIAIGKKARTNTELKVGDLVQGFYPHITPRGTLSEYILLNAFDKTYSQVTNIPSNLTLTDASSWPLVYGTAHQLIEGLKLKGKKILVLGGATSVGRYLLQLLKYEGAREIIATCSPRSIDIVTTLGATSTIDYTKGPILSTILESVIATSTFDYVFDCVGSTELFSHIYHIFPEGGGHYGSIVGDATVGTLNWKALTVAYGVVSRTVFSTLGLLGYHYEVRLLNHHGDWIHKGKQLIEEGKLRIFIDSYFKFNELDKALKVLESERAVGKVIVKVESD
ncbi:uncharacterized protein RJT21DRAFT_31391 [Scheffersomyces amazonensis]|uniref:uncharacterized protein n=1 Tax=Scheffersomyces amazonensis TaxID=1078765 RepID=UPI00315DB55B